MTGESLIVRDVEGSGLRTINGIIPASVRTEEQNQGKSHEQPAPRPKFVTGIIATQARRPVRTKRETKISTETKNSSNREMKQKAKKIQVGDKKKEGRVDPMLR